MQYVLSESQRLFIDAYGEINDFDIDTIINRAFAALAEYEAEQNRLRGAIGIKYLNEVIDRWCKKYKFRWNGSLVRQEANDHWLLFDEFSTEDFIDVAFPKHWLSFQQFLKANGFAIDEKSPGCFSIREYTF